MKTTEERFWEKVSRAGSNQCWNWVAGLHNGYGNFWLEGRNAFAHRFAYELMVGPIPDGLVIDHLCRNTRCVNPSHLEPVPIRINNLRGVGFAARNASRESCPQGHPYGGENLLIFDGKRHCRECRRQRLVEYRSRRGPVQLTAEQRARKTHLQRLRNSGGAS